MENGKNIGDKKLINKQVGLSILLGIMKLFFGTIMPNGFIGLTHIPMMSMMFPLMPGIYNTKHTSGGMINGSYTLDIGLKELKPNGGILIILHGLSMITILGNKNYGMKIHNLGYLMNGLLAIIDSLMIANGYYMIGMIIIFNGIKLSNGNIGIHIMPHGEFGIKKHGNIHYMTLHLTVGSNHGNIPQIEKYNIK